MGNRDGFVSRAEHADVAVVLVTYNNADHLPELLADLRRDARERAIRVIVVDNNSVDGSAVIAEHEAGAVVVRSGGNLGYAGGINRARDYIGPCDAILIINPDLRLCPGATSKMLATLRTPGVGAVAPLMVDEHGDVFPSLSNEPTIMRSMGDLVFGAIWPKRPAALTEKVRNRACYRHGHAVDWATGAALILRSEVAAAVGSWDEQFFLYSEETDYCRRIRDHGYTIAFEPDAVVEHIGGGSGSSPALTALMAVNKVRYVEKYHSRLFSAGFRALVALSSLRRVLDPAHRNAVSFLLDRGTWPALPAATLTPVPPQLDGGAVIIPAHNEATVIANTLAPLSPAAVEGTIEVIVVCNGCSDETAKVARDVPGIKVIEIETPSKVAALNVGDDAAMAWPRMYLDADIEITPEAIAQVFHEFRSGHVLAARPTAQYETSGSTAPVRRYYQARQRIPQFKDALWGAGAYALSEEGHRRIGRFPTVTADDLWIDQQFVASEKRVVLTKPTLVSTPRDSRSLLRTLRRVYRGADQVPSGNASGRSLKSLVTAVRGPGTAMDAFVYISFAVAGRRASRKQRLVRWERDDSSRMQLRP